MKLSLGPIQYYWSGAMIRRFYNAVLDWPVDTVYLGEVVCAKRTELGLNDWLVIADELDAAGKEVVLSTMTLVEEEYAMHALQRICDNGDYRVEANDYAAVRLIAGRPFIAGPYINAYNGSTLHLLMENGAKRWVVPYELSRAMLAEVLADMPDDLQTEVFVYGRIPLSHSTRCFTARAHNLENDCCEIKCKNYPDGIVLQTQNDENLFNINGLQMQSARPCNLLDNISALKDMGVDMVRIAPQAKGTLEIVQMFDRARREDNYVVADDFCKQDWCNGYWYDEPGMCRISNEDKLVPSASKADD